MEFANILRNNNVTIGIFDDYKNISKVNGVQISGKLKLQVNNSLYFTICYGYLYKMIKKVFGKILHFVL